ncbi:MAG TPA: penicillin-binding transpeptidase domain-containing protein, partial [Cytophagales bacterium]
AHYSPVNHPQRARWKRNAVLDKMVKHKFLTAGAYARLVEQPLGLRFTPDNPNRGLATYLRGYLEGELLRWARQNNFDLYTDGLRIRTTLDARLQRHAERVVAEQMAAQQAKFEAHLGGQTPWVNAPGGDYLRSVVRRSARYRQLKAQYGDDEDSIWLVLRRRVPMRVFAWDGEKDTLMSPLDSVRYYKRFLHAGLLAMDPVSGEVRAWVGGINYKHFKYDHVRQGRRQPGSAFKPIVYAAAIANMGYTPCTEELDAPITINGWTARNYSRAYTNEPVTLRQALGQSLNTVPARITQKLGVPAVIDYARRLGITGKLRPYPALCLGTEAVSVYELLGAYATFANGGVWTLPRYVTRIEDRYGNVLHQFTPRRQEAMNAEHAYLMTNLLQSGLGERGSAQALGQYAMTRNNEVGAKTGTTQNYADGWCVVLTQELATAVWFGGDDMRVHYRDGNGTGSRTALPIAGEFMDRAFADPAAGLKKGSFRRPRTLSVDLDCNRNPVLAARNDSTLYVPPAKNDSLLNAGFVEEF